MQRYSRFLAAVRSGLSRLENGRLGLRCVSFAELCYFTKNFYGCRKNFSAPLKYKSLYSVVKFFVSCWGTRDTEGEGRRGVKSLRARLNDYKPFAG